MPITLTYPGVYVQELPGAGRAIHGVSTSVIAVIGYFTQGPPNQAVRIQNTGEFQRVFGGLDEASLGSYALLQFFNNGGAEAWVVRTAKSTTANPWQAAGITIQNAPNTGTGTPVLKATAANPGVWGNQVKLTVDHNTDDPATQFNLTTTVYRDDRGTWTIASQQSWNALSMQAGETNYAPTAVNNTVDTPVLLTAVSTTSTSLPAQSGSRGTDLSSFDPTKFVTGSMHVTLTDGSGGTKTTSVTISSDGVTSLYALPAAVQSGLRSVSWLASANVLLVDSKLIIALSDPQYANAKLTFADGQGQSMAATLGLNNATVNVQAYSLGVGVVAGSQSSPILGGNGDLPGADELIGSSLQHTGLYALDTVDVFNLLCVPRMSTLADENSNAAATFISTATRYCESRFAMLLVDLPMSVDTIQEASAWVSQNVSLAHKNVVYYFPNIVLADSLNDYRPKIVPPSGTMAGVIARTDNAVGVWKAPAGVAAQLFGIQSLAYKMTDQENGVLNPKGLNCLRSFAAWGNIAWGARTSVGSDQRADDWKYLPVRRLALYIEESLQVNLQWAVFEPNDEPLWSSIRQSVETFMNNLYLKHAFQGSTTNEAYFVLCGPTTTSQSDIDAGIVNVVVGFAPLKPAEFVVVTVQQIAGQSQT